MYRTPGMSTYEAQTRVTSLAWGAEAQTRDLVQAQTLLQAQAQNLTRA